MTSPELVAAYTAGVLRARDAYRQHLAELETSEAQGRDDNPGGRGAVENDDPAETPAVASFFAAETPGERVNSRPERSTR